MLKKLWMDEGGATISAELALIGTILVVGVVVGLSAVQDAVVTELADLGQAISDLDQSYSSGGILGHHAFTAQQNFSDAEDDCDTGGTGGGSRCVTICAGTGTTGGSDGP